ncbi:head-tail connector protein [Staphylococcus nepalensis]|uniref:head-tail connector protein n=1 Tax=Staphylococcus nepalensis TaxID=214473 RepID=UPI002B259FD7|nr:head-tail connector protein [Staphylococcus nepalensis]WQL19470.1 head-tail connector protein [Staphylococcus nepalensis]
MDLEALKVHMHVTHNMEDDNIKRYMEWAESDIKDAVYPDNSMRDEEFFENNKVYERALFLLTKYYFEIRIAYSDTQYAAVPNGVLGAIQKLRGAYPYES